MTEPADIIIDQAIEALVELERLSQEWTASRKGLTLEYEQEEAK